MESSAPQIAPLRMRSNQELYQRVLTRFKDEYGFDDLLIARTAKDELFMEAACRNEAAALFPDSHVAWEQWTSGNWKFPNPDHDLRKQDVNNTDNFYRGLLSDIPQEFIAQISPVIDTYFPARAYSDVGRGFADKTSNDLSFDEPIGKYENSERLMPIEDVSGRISLIASLWELSTTDSRFDVNWTASIFKKYKPLWNMRFSHYKDASRWIRNVAFIVTDTNEALEKQVITASERSEYLSQIGLMDLGALSSILSEKLGRGTSDSVKQTNRLGSTL